MKTEQVHGLHDSQNVARGWAFYQVVYGDPRRPIACRACGKNLPNGTLFIEPNYPNLIFSSPDSAKAVTDHFRLKSVRQFRICLPCYHSISRDDGEPYQPSHWVTDFIEDSKLISVEAAKAILDSFFPDEAAAEASDLSA